MHANKRRLASSSTTKSKPSRVTEMESRRDATKPAKGKGRLKDLDQAREILNGLQAMSKVDKMKNIEEYTEVLNIVMDAVLKMSEDSPNRSSDHSDTSTTVAETVGTETVETNEIEVVSQLFSEWSRAEFERDDEIWTYEKHSCHRTDIEPEPYQWTARNYDDWDYSVEPYQIDDDVIDEVAISMGLGGYEEGFNPRRFEIIHEASEESFEERDKDKKPMSVHKQGYHAPCSCCAKLPDGKTCTKGKFCI